MLYVSITLILSVIIVHMILQPVIITYNCGHSYYNHVTMIIHA